MPNASTTTLSARRVVGWLLVLIRCDGEGEVMKPAKTWGGTCTVGLLSIIINTPFIILLNSYNYREMFFIKNKDVYKGVNTYALRLKQSIDR